MVTLRRNLSLSNSAAVSEHKEVCECVHIHLKVIQNHDSCSQQEVDGLSLFVKTVSSVQ